MEQLATYLKSNGITQSAFARMVNVSQPTVNRWMKGVARPPWDKAAEIDRLTGGRVPISTWAAQEAAE